jgi:hypothetical protein
MGPKLSSEPKMERMPRVLDFINSHTGRLALGNDTCGRIAAAGAQAFCAACMSCSKGEVILEVSYNKGQLHLMLSFAGKGQARPYGLAPALFASQKCRIKLEQDRGNWLWTATWEVQP